MAEYFKRSMLVASLIGFFSGVLSLVFLDPKSYLHPIILILISYGFFRVYRNPEKNFQRPVSKWALLIIAHLITIGFLGGFIFSLIAAFKS